MLPALEASLLRAQNEIKPALTGFNVEKRRVQVPLKGLRQPVELVLSTTHGRLRVECGSMSVGFEQLPGASDRCVEATVRSANHKWRLMVEATPGQGSRLAVVVRAKSEGPSIIPWTSGEAKISEHRFVLNVVGDQRQPDQELFPTLPLAGAANRSVALQVLDANGAPHGATLTTHAGRATLKLSHQGQENRPFAVRVDHTFGGSFGAENTTVAVSGTVRPRLEQPQVVDVFGRVGGRVFRAAADLESGRQVDPSVAMDYPVVLTNPKSGERLSRRALVRVCADSVDVAVFEPPNSPRFSPLVTGAASHEPGGKINTVFSGGNTISTHGEGLGQLGVGVLWEPHGIAVPTQAKALARHSASMAMGDWPPRR